MGEQWNRRPGKAPVLAERNKDGVVYLSFPLLEGCGLVSHGFSTRLGGVSEGELSSMNLGFSRGDDRERVLEALLKQNFVPIVDSRNVLCGIVTRRSAMKYLFEEQQ